MERAEKLAGLEPIEGGDFHPYRRAWATSRKHLPARDVAALGGWRDLRSLENCYQQTDAETLLAVALDATKLREKRAGAVSKAASGRVPALLLVPPQSSLLLAVERGEIS